jgi:hypothetical protein
VPQVSLYYWIDVLPAALSGKSVTGMYCKNGIGFTPGLIYSPQLVLCGGSITGKEKIYSMENRMDVLPTPNLGLSIVYSRVDVLLQLPLSLWSA